MPNSARKRDEALDRVVSGNEGVPVLAVVSDRLYETLTRGQLRFGYCMHFSTAVTGIQTFQRHRRAA